MMFALCSVLLQSILLLQTVNCVVKGATGEVCEDVDTHACQLMLHNKHDLCNDTALAEHACKRFCGLCPVRCLSCPTNVRRLSHCTDVEYCDTNQDCYTMEVFDFDGSHTYRAGCMAKTFCVPDPSTMLGRSSSNIKMSCCDSDMCNQKLIHTTTTTTTTTKRPTTAAHHCSNHLPSNICQLLACHDRKQDCKKHCGLCCKDFHHGIIGGQSMVW